MKTVSVLECKILYRCRRELVERAVIVCRPEHVPELRPILRSISDAMTAPRVIW